MNHSADSDARGNARGSLAYQVMRFMARLGLAEPEVLGLECVVRAGDHVFDVGAAYGMYSVPLAHLVGRSGGVHSFEPQRRQQRTLRLLKRLIGATQVRTHQGALGADAGHSTLLVPVRYGVTIYGHAHLEPDADAAPGAKRVTMRRSPTSVDTIDGWSADKGIERVSFIKADVEGFEPSVLDGAAAMIAAVRPSLLLEIEDRHLARYGTDANGFADLIRETWPWYRMYTWKRGDWHETPHIVPGVRNYLFATDEALARA